MQNPRYYRLVRTLAALLIAAPVVAAAQSPTPAPVDASASCDELKRDPLPAWTDSAVNSKRLTDCGYAFAHLGDYARAQQVFAVALEMARRRSDRSAEAIALDGDGLTLGTLGHPDRAEPLLQESFSISEELNDKDGMAEASSQLGHLRTMRARYDEAREFHLRSFALWGAIDQRHGMAVALNNVGATYQSEGDYVAAAEYYQRALDGLEQLGDRRRSATVIDNLARIARTLGDYAKGLDLSRRALEIRRTLDDKDGTARSLTSLSEGYRAQGNYTAALEALRQSLDLFTEVGYAHAIAETLDGIAVIYEAQGNYTQAARYLRKSLAFNETKVGSTSLTAAIYAHLGEVYFAHGDTPRAVAALQRSLGISARGKFKPQAADAGQTLGRVYTTQHRLASAAVALQRVLRYREAAGDQSGRAEALVSMADVERGRRRYPAALALATEARDLAGSLELVDVEWMALTALGRVDVALARPADARRAFEQAIDIVEDLRVRNRGDEETRRQFFADRLAPYHERIELALAASNTADAFRFAERSRARALLDVIRSDRMPPTKAMTADERVREVELRTSLNSVNNEVLQAAQTVPRDEGHIDTLKRKRDARRLAYEEFQTGLYAAHAGLQVDRAAVPVVDAAEAQRLLPSPSAAIVEFVAGPDRIHAFVITTSGLRSFLLPAGTSEIGRRVRQFRDQLARRDLRAADSGRSMYDLLLGPMRAQLRGVAELIIVPDGVLWDLPFQALQPVAGRYLIEDAAISYSPSVTVLREAMRRNAQPRPGLALLAFGNPSGLAPLPETEKEVTQSAETYGASSRVYVGVNASEDRWKAEAPKFGIVHIATHGVLDNASPMYSHLSFARPGSGDHNDGVLEAWEVMDMQLHADLVVLSACETARGRIAPGEGVVGLMWAFFVAGAPATLVSQWAVNSASSTQLMVAFHREWRGGQRGVSKARALQVAAVKVLKTPGFEHPFYWAAFILAGDGR